MNRYNDVYHLLHYESAGARIEFFLNCKLF